MRRLLTALLGGGLLAMASTSVALAGAPPFRTVVDELTPAIAGLTIVGNAGGCDLLVDNTTGQDLLFFDQGTPAQPLKISAGPKGAARPPVPVHLVGKWPCATLPEIGEDERWNRVTIRIPWSLRGQIGTVPLQLRAHTLYDPSMDPLAQLLLGVRIVGGLAVVAALWMVPYLVSRRRQIMSGR